jgi:phosphoglycerate dehydrogenase-like enzyme
MNRQTNTSTNALIVLTPKEKDDFFPSPYEDQLRELLPDANWVEAPLGDPAEFLTVLEAVRPEILVGAWETPGLPVEELQNGHLPVRYLCYLAGSVRNLVSRDLIDNGLTVTNWGNAISDTVAECALLLILSCMRRSTDWAIAMHNEGKWKSGRHPDTQSLFGRRIGLHGLGAIGQDLVRLLRPFHVDIEAYSPSVPDSVFEHLGVTRVNSLEELFSRSEVLVDLAAAKPENFHVVDEAMLRRLPDGATFVNVGRGMVVDEDALARVAREGNLQIGLDVYETEPLPPDSPLRGLRNVNLLPHLGGPTRDRRIECGKLAIRNIRHYLDRAPLENLVTTEVYDRAT